MRRLALYLNINSVITCRKVCRHWQRVIDSHESLWRREEGILGLEPPSAELSSPEPLDSEEESVEDAERAVQEAEHKLSEVTKALVAAAAARPPAQPLSHRRQSRLSAGRRRVLLCNLGAPPRFLPRPDLLLHCPITGTALTANEASWTLSRGSTMDFEPPVLPPGARLDAWTIWGRHVLLGFGDRVLRLGHSPLQIFEHFPYAGLQQVTGNSKYCVARAASHVVFWRAVAPRSPTPLDLIHSPRSLCRELLFLYKEDLLLAAWDIRTVYLVTYDLENRHEESLQVVKLNPLTDLATVRGVCAWAEMGHYVTLAIYGERIGHVTVYDWNEEDRARWAEVSEIDNSYRASDGCLLVGAGSRLFVLWQPYRRVLQFYSRRVNSGPVRQLDLSAAGLRGPEPPDFRFGTELNRGLPCDRVRPVVSLAQGLRHGSGPSVTISFA